jgi:hypothetical protein
MWTLEEVTGRQRSFDAEDFINSGRGRGRTYPAPWPEFRDYQEAVECAERVGRQRGILLRVVQAR